MSPFLLPRGQFGLVVLECKAELLRAASDATMWAGTFSSISISCALGRPPRKHSLKVFPIS